MRYLTDEELVSQYLETRRNIYFEQLYERYCNKVHRTCLSFTKDTTQAEDLTQDIFIRLIAKLEGYKKQAKFSTWLYSITHNYCADQLKTPRRRQEIAINEHWTNLIATDDSAEREEAIDQLIQIAMSKLGDDEQQLLRQKYQDEVSIKDLASYYSLTESAIKMRLKRSRDRLREFYQQVAIR
jgi:RNA polymerase sigma factor (sigma-70 family)